jgi:hypothetical protein
MPRRRNLKSIPHNITKSFFGTMRFSEGGYMADWLVNVAKNRNIKEGHLDVFAECILPEELNLPVFSTHIKDLKEIILKELKSNDFSVDFIVEAGIKLKFQNDNGQPRAIYCYPFMVDKEGYKYEGAQIIEYAYENGFAASRADDNPKVNFLTSLWRIFKK